ncbi:MAG: PTS sugar transporter subunit IIA [Candidatus Izemoplasmatales bacterium]|jgi:fructose-specific phosphotransferase system IIA component|nr:PTS sugar transporter subunit IIA [Candidatus Izemoplasmatales bacterium]
MELNELMDVELINLNLEANNKYETINALAQMLHKKGYLNNLIDFIEDVFKREQTESTNMDIGVAIPHSNSLYVNKTSVVIARLNHEIKWDDDGEPVMYIFLFAASSQDKEISHLDLISKIAEILVDDDFIDFLQKTNSSKELLEKIKSLTGGKI